MSKAPVRLTDRHMGVPVHQYRITKNSRYADLKIDEVAQNPRSDGRKAEMVGSGWISHGRSCQPIRMSTLR